MPEPRGPVWGSVEPWWQMVQSSAFAPQPCLQPRSSPVEHLPMLNAFFLEHLLLLEVSYLKGKFK